MALPSGVRLGSYEILGAVGAGGMGEVYRARDSKLGRDVAIKVLPEVFARDPVRVMRFEREAKLLAALNWPNIAAIYGIEDSNGSLALVMEYVDGPTLADRIDSGPIPMEEVLPIARQITDALEYAHEHGVVHRDLKPANVKVTAEDAVKILDFGLAKAVQGEASDVCDSPTLSQMATESGMLLGTAAYMSPEQAKGKPVDRRADVWAFGCVLYEMLTGMMAFRGDTVTETLAAILSSEPDWSLLPAATPIRVRVLLQRCLQKDPKQRLRDIGEARISLDEVLNDAPDAVLAGTALDSSAWRRRALTSAVVALVMFIASAWLVFAHFRKQPDAPSESMRFHVALPEQTSSLTDLELSPDGRHLAIAAMKQGGRPQLWIRDLDSLESRPLSGTEGVSRVSFWAPNSRSLAFENGGKLQRVEISGGTPQTICAVDGFSGGAWNRDGVIVFSSNKGLMKVSAAGGEPSILIKMRPSRGETWLRITSFLPDGRHFLYFRAMGVLNPMTYVGSLDVEDEQQASKPLVAGGWAIYVPTLGGGYGKILFLKPDRTLVAQAFDTSRLELKGAPSPVAEDVGAFDISANVLAYTRESERTVQQFTWFDRQGKVLGTVGDPGLFSSHPTISPDDRTVAVSLQDNLSGKVDLWLYDLKSGRRTRFTLDGKANIVPVWSPDSSRIAFFSADRTAPPWVYQKPVNGVGHEEAFESPPGNRSGPSDWSRDGRYLIELEHGEKNSIWVLPLSQGQTGGEHKLFPLLKGDYNASGAKLSPDGKWIAYRSDETGRDEIFVTTFPNPRGKWPVSANGGIRPVWSRDGKELYYIASDGNLMAVAVNSRPDGSFDVASPKVLFHPTTQEFPLDTFDVTKDGRFLIPVLTQQQSSTPITVVVNWQAGLK